MAEFVLVNKEELEAGLTTISDSIRAKAGISEKLAFPAGMKNAVDNIILQQGSQVQRKTGTVTVNNGAATVNCGFKPDLVAITGFSVTMDNYGTFECMLCFSFSETTSSRGKLATCYDVTKGILIANISVSSSGFSLSNMTNVAQDFTTTTVNWRTFNYVAIKYTE